MFGRTTQREKVCTFCDIVVRFCQVWCISSWNSRLLIYFHLFISLMNHLTFPSFFFSLNLGLFKNIQTIRHLTPPKELPSHLQDNTIQCTSLSLSLSVSCMRLSEWTWIGAETPGLVVSMSSRRVMQRSYSGDGRTGLHNADDVSGRSSSRSYLSNVRPESRYTPNNSMGYIEALRFVIDNIDDKFMSFFPSRLQSLNSSNSAIPSKKSCKS